jgi:hypothetical protein
MAMAGALGATVSIDLTRRRLGLSWGDLGEGCAAALTGAGAMAVAVTAMRLTVVDDRWSDAGALALLVPTGAAVFAVVFVVADRGATLRALAALAQALRDADAPPRLSAGRGGDEPVG